MPNNFNLRTSSAAMANRDWLTPTPLKETEMKQSRRTLMLAGIATSAMTVFRPLHAQSLVPMRIATGVDPSFSAFYIAKERGIFEKNGLDVTLQTGPSGSAMVSFIIGNQIQAALGTEMAGIQNFNLDNNVVVFSEMTRLEKFFGLLGRNMNSVEEMKGKRVGVARGTGGETFWLAIVEKLKLDPRDYTVINLEAPEMIPAFQRGNIDAFAAWEPWVTRATMALPNVKNLRDNQGILDGRIFGYLNQGWAEKNRSAATAFVKSLVEATDLVVRDPETAAKTVSSFLKLDLDLTRRLIANNRFDMRLDQASLEGLQLVERQVQSQGKLLKPVDWSRFVSADLLRQVRPEKVGFKLPT
jgi:ABC-type nitrate/sulfonate/bicarbonate transport system substrate-binding protein